MCLIFNSVHKPVERKGTIEQNSIFKPDILQNYNSITLGFEENLKESHGNFDLQPTIHVSPTPSEFAMQRNIELKGDELSLSQHILRIHNGWEHLQRR